MSSDRADVVLEVEALRQTVARVESLARWWASGPSASRDTMTREVAAHDLNRALEGK